MKRCKRSTPGWAPWGAAALLWAAALSPVVPGAAEDYRSWQALSEDRLHDPANPNLHELQQPAEALSALPQDAVGNKVRWVQALREGLIQPRTNILPETKIQILDLDLIYGKTGDRGYVRFPHRAHSEWLDCANCHEKIFKQKFGATQFNMNDILQGKFCGKCHGAVAFPLTECDRCHSVKQEEFNGSLGPQKVAR
ncbi:MAG: hypothetical protein HQL51_03815 [Magnetococcales bacterium]|nr:hypothetical protein [Magnetococcales bacterium]